MAMRVDTSVEPGLLRVTLAGPFTIQEAQAAFLETLEALARHGTDKTLVDGRELKGEPDTIQRFLYGEFAATSVARYIDEGRIPATPQFAYVLHEPVLDPRRFGETVALNRGMWVKAFDDLDEAVAWLGQGKTST